MRSARERERTERVMGVPRIGLGDDIGEVGDKVCGPAEPVLREPLGQESVRAAAGVDGRDERLVLLR